MTRKGPAPAFHLQSRVNAPRSWWLGLSREQMAEALRAEEQRRMASNPHKGTGGEKRIVGSGRAITGAR